MQPLRASPIPYKALNLSCNLNECKPLPATYTSSTKSTERWVAAGPIIRGSHSSTSRLNVRTFCWIRWVHDFPPVYQTGGYGQA
jgi:hypothetical protein